MDTISSIPIRTTPRLWVEAVWLLESLEAEQPIREINLERGLNLIVSPPHGGSTGHGVGKTAFCQVLRFVLDDPLWGAGSSLRDELQHHYRDGAVAARVHVGNEMWTVVKPWQHQKHYRAARDTTWQQLARNEVQNEYAVYVAALQTHMVDCLPVKELPGSNQPIQWHQILAWCARDQNARYQSYFQWRAEGAGFSLPAKAPPLLMKIVLGLLKDARTLNELERQDKKVKELESGLDALKRQSTDLLAHVRRQLARQLEANDSTPFRQEGLFEHPNLLGMAKQRHVAYEQDLTRIDARRVQMEGEKQTLIEQRAPLSDRIRLLANRIGQLEAGIAKDWERMDKLRNEASSLQQQLSTQCNAGNRLLRDCHYVMDRVDYVQFDRAQNIAKHRESEEKARQELPLARQALQRVQTDCAPIDQQLARLAGEGKELAERYATVLSLVRDLRNAIEDYELYEGVETGKPTWPKITDAEKRLGTARDRFYTLEAKQKAEDAAAQERRKVIHRLMDQIARNLPRFDWGVFNDDEKHKNRPFRLGPMRSTTFGVLETLAGDIACLLDSTGGESFHPGFLLHDSPREAEMSEAMFWALVSAARGDANAAFQYIVTTSTEANELFGPFVRLHLHSLNGTGYLFGRRLDVEDEPLAM